MKKYAGECWGIGPVYLMEDGSYLGERGERVRQCKFCLRFLPEHFNDNTCDGCWEVTHRLADFVKTEAGMAFVVEVLK